MKNKLFTIIDAIATLVGKIGAGLLSIAHLFLDQYQAATFFLLLTFYFEWQEQKTRIRRMQKDEIEM